MDFLDRFWKNAEISNFMKIHPMGTEMFHADGQTGLQLIAAFRNFATAPKNDYFLNLICNLCGAYIQT